MKKLTETGRVFICKGHEETLCRNWEDRFIIGKTYAEVDLDTWDENHCMDFDKFTKIQPKKDDILLLRVSTHTTRTLYVDGSQFKMQKQFRPVEYKEVPAHWEDE